MVGCASFQAAAFALASASDVAVNVCVLI